MARKTNAELMNAIVPELPQEHQEKFEGLGEKEIARMLADYPTTRNEFINTLTNKVAKSLIFTKVYENPLKMLKKDSLDYGDSIEELFVQMAEMKNFDEHWDLDGSDEADLIRALKPKVTALYIQKNYDKQFKTTVYDKQLKKAFTNKYGLSNLINNIVTSISNKIEYSEFKATKETLLDLVAEAKGLNELQEKETLPIGKAIKQTPYCVGVSDIKEFCKVVKEEAGNMKFYKECYNLSKELTFANADELVLFTTPSTSADMDVNVLASAFNVSNAEIPTRTILLDEMPKGIFKKTGVAIVDKTPTALSTGDTVEMEELEVMGVLADKELLQILDTDQGSGTFYNPQKKFTNHFANREGIFATCGFANMVVIYKKK